MIGMTGLNHISAPVDVREKLHLNADECLAFLTLCKEITDISGAVVLSTCNRTEIYFTGRPGCAEKTCAELERGLLRFKNVPLNISCGFYRYPNREAVLHLLRVASGLDSMVLGENQILGQVKEAYRLSTHAQFTGTVINRLFHRAFEAGKRVRTETGINRGASSIGSAAVKLAGELFGDLCERSVLLIGAGETGETVVQCLKQSGVKNFTVMNRTHTRAEALARKYEGVAPRFSALASRLAETDIVIVSTSSDTFIITEGMVKKAMKHRDNRSLFCIDLSVPRNIDPAISREKLVTLRNIDDLRTIVADNFNKRKGEIRKATRIIGEVEQDFFDWIGSLNLSPTIEALKLRLGAMTKQELQRIVHKMPEAHFKAVSGFTGHLTEKICRMIITNLKQHSGNGSIAEYIELVNNLFNLKVK